MEFHEWELIVGAGLLILGQGGVLHLGLRRYINGMGETVKEIKIDTRDLLAGQHHLDTRVSLLESDVSHIKEQI